MARTGRPPLSDDQVRERISAYCARSGVTQRHAEGFPVYPAGLRATKQHREWTALHRLFSRARLRANPPVPSSEASCPVCLRPARPAGSMHARCAEAVALVRELGAASVDRLRAAACAPARPRTGKG
jgi:hypothetical protein